MEQSIPYIDIFNRAILVSATFWSGPPHELMVLAQNGKIIHFTSSAMVEEFLEIILRDFQKSRDEAKEIVAHMLSFSALVEPQVTVQIVEKDHDDNKLFEAAIAAGAEYIVSGDSHLLEIREFMGVKVVTAREFLQLVSRE